MNISPYIKNQDEEEFETIFDQRASKIWKKRISTRQKAADELVKLGLKAVRPLLYVMECEAWDESDDDSDRVWHDVEEILVRIGEEAIPILKEYIDNGECNFYVNEFAQIALFKVMGLEDIDRRKVCRHNEKILMKDGNKSVWRCMFCDSKFRCTKNQKVGKMIKD